MTSDAVAAQIIRQYEQERGVSDQAVRNAVVRIVGACLQARLEGRVDAHRESARRWARRRSIAAWHSARADQLEEGRA